MYYCYPVYYYSAYPYRYDTNRQFPNVNPDHLYEAANETRVLMREASVVLDRFAGSKEFGKRVMSAAQKSNMPEVKRLIKSIGVTSDIDVNYNPDELRMAFISKIKNTECCRLTVALRWS
ncbi:hypothetical protein [Ornithinibacillus xuwenensis]|uniref:Uncharacterized protein n=1 Tax=Ornithinibacillus xuwenensis TaxID=3144668 RepID=A0ABU9XEH9_9BACI